ncbi:protein kinase domain-containing protein [Streptomyces hokutonensis]|uniref:protein kinase domain-containing protein n=1 Tax=Streptomyces hokutonensis TaxID=1306990 RepID=UPI000364FF2A|nr:hypothetical protein [Streptomyces hokutonensis]
MSVVPAAGDRIDGRYLLREPIGTGGTGVVWRAWDERLQRWVAVKCARLDDDRATRRLMGEARNAGRLHHPNIVAVFDYVDEGTTELFQLTVYAPEPGRQLCGTAAELAGGVVRNIAKRLPVG